MTLKVDPRRLCQVEIQVSDRAAAVAFYRDAFGWPPVPADLHDFVILEVPEGCPFGISLVPPRDGAPRSAGRPGNLVLYFAVDDPAQILAQVERCGGKVRFGPLAVAGYGSVYQCEDLDGTRFGFYLKAATLP